jgi:hypothetical protein
LQNRLLVNGVPVQEGQLAYPFWTELLPRLGRESRAVERRRLDSTEQERVVAAAVAAGGGAEEIVANLTTDGLDEATIQPLIEDMVALRDTPRPAAALALLAGVLVLILLGLFLSAAATSGSAKWPFYGPVAFGLGIGGTALVRLVTRAPWTTEQLLRAWRNGGGARPHSRPLWPWMAAGGVGLLLLLGLTSVFLLRALDFFGVAPAGSVPKAAEAWSRDASWSSGGSDGSSDEGRSATGKATAGGDKDTRKALGKDPSR